MENLEELMADLLHIKQSLEVCEHVREYLKVSTYKMEQMSKKILQLKQMRLNQSGREKVKLAERHLLKFKKMLIITKKYNNANIKWLNQEMDELINIIDML